MKTEDNSGFTPPTYVSRPRSPLWRMIAETVMISGVTSTATFCITDAIFKSDSFFIRWAVFALLYVSFNFLYQHVVRGT